MLGSLQNLLLVMSFLAVGFSNKLGSSPQASGSFQYQRICKTGSGEKGIFDLTGLDDALTWDGMCWDESLTVASCLRCKRNAKKEHRKVKCLWRPRLLV